MNVTLEPSVLLLMHAALPSFLLCHVIFFNLALSFLVPAASFHHIYKLSLAEGRFPFPDVPLFPSVASPEEPPASSIPSASEVGAMP